MTEHDPRPAADADFYMARQPIVDAERRLVGFELLFRPAGAGDSGEAPDALFATSSVVASVFADIGIEQVIGDVDGYLNVDAEFLFSDFIEALPPAAIVLELLETVIAEERTIERVRELRAAGYRVGVDNFVGNFADFEPLLREVDMVKIDFQAIDPLLVPMIVKMLGRHDVALLAGKIETRLQFEQARELGIAMFQGYHFARPEGMRASKARPTQFALLRLMSLVYRDAETREIESELKHHPTLSVNLLRLANSAAIGSRHTITSLRHALVLLGRRQLHVWLQLLLYTAEGGNDPASVPLLQTAAARGKLLEQLAGRLPESSGTLVEMAFMTGMLSLMDVLLGMPIDDILRQVSVAPAVVDALLRREGPLGRLLVLAEQLEADRHEEVLALLRNWNGFIAPGELLPMQVAAYRWANEVVGMI